MTNEPLLKLAILETSTTSGSCAWLTPGGSRMGRVTSSARTQVREPALPGPVPVRSALLFLLQAGAQSNVKPFSLFSLFPPKTKPTVNSTGPVEAEMVSTVAELFCGFRLPSRAAPRLPARRGPVEHPVVPAVEDGALPPLRIRFEREKRTKDDRARGARQR